jgi:hypothetical protein
MWTTVSSFDQETIEELPSCFAVARAGPALAPKGRPLSGSQKMSIGRGDVVIHQRATPQPVKRWSVFEIVGSRLKLRVHFLISKKFHGWWKKQKNFHEDHKLPACDTAGGIIRRHTHEPPIHLAPEREAPGSFKLLPELGQAPLVD